jgi:WD40 repeat protein/serine/threonine protein kinase
MGAPLPEQVERDDSSFVPGVRTVIANAGRIDSGELALLLRAHQQRAWRAGQPVYVEAYLKELPGWAADDPEVLELIWCEILLREERGEQPLLAEYELRFPKFGSQLHRLAALQQALRSPSARLERTRVVDDEPLTLPPLGAHRAGDAEAQATNVRPIVPGYTILGELGRGGMGVVYKARQVSLGRLVALKMVLAGVHASAEQLARFRSEAAAVARLQHPNIVPIYEISDFQGNPYYSLEFAEGGSLSRYLDGTPLPPKTAARFIETLAGAIEAAHSQGIIHRDLKPGNVLLKQVQRSATQWLERSDGPAGFLDTRFWTPKITDFGLAKQFEEKDPHAKTQPMTHSGAIVGTPCYMPPEQAGGRGQDLGATADVYSLGAILYELLTGRPPFRASSSLDTLLQVISDDPIPPMRLQPGIPRDLNTICLKCLAKEPRQRYASAQQLADELHRFLSGRPILARPIPFWVRGMKWARRRPAAAILFVILALSSVLGVVSAPFFYLYLQRRHESQLDDERYLSARNRYFDQIGAVDRADSPEKAIEALDGCGLAVNGKALRGWEWNYLRGRANGARSWLPEAKGLYCAWRPQDDRIAIADVEENRLTFWDAREGRQLGNLDGLGPGLAYSLDGRTLAVAESSQHIEGPHAIVLLDGQTQSEIRRLTGHTRTITAIAWSRDGKRLASASLDHSLRLWDAGSGRLEASFDIGSGWVGNVCFTPDGSALATGQADGFSVWDLAGNKLAFSITSGEEPDQTDNTLPEKVNAWQQRLDRAVPPWRQLAHRSHPIAINSYGVLAYARESSISLWDLDKRKTIATLSGHSHTVRALAFTADGERLASAGDDRVVRVWETRTGRELAVLRGHARPIAGLSFAVDGRRVASVALDALDGTRIWDITADRTRAVLGNRAPDAAAIDAEGESIAAATRESRLFKAADGSLVCLLAKKPFSVAAFQGANEWLATGGFDGTIELWHTRTHALRKTLKGHQSPIVALAINQKGDRLASASADGSIRIWDVETGQAALSVQGPARRISALALNPPGTWPNGTSLPDGAWLIVGGQEGYLALWQLSEGQHLQELADTGVDITSLAFSSDGLHFAYGATDGRIRYWDMRLRQEVRAINTTSGGITAIAFHPSEDRPRLVTGGNDGSVQLWEPLTGHEILKLPGHVSPVIQIRFTRDGEKLLAMGADGTVVTWSGQPTDDNPSLARDPSAAGTPPSGGS